MCKIRKSLFLFLTTICLLAAAFAPAFIHKSHSIVYADSIVIDGNSAEYAAGFTVSDGELTGCSALASLNVPFALILPANVTKLADGVFQNNGNLTGVVLPEGLTEIGARAFAHTPLVSVQIPASVKKVGEEAFRDCAALSSVEFTQQQDNADSESGAVTGFSNLEIGARAFASCWSLFCVELPARCHTVGNGAFEGCISLQWAYVNSAALAQATDLFPENVTVVFSDRAGYEAAQSHLPNATYLVTVEYYTQGSSVPVLVQKKLHGREFSYVRNEDKNSREYGGWEKIDGEALPAQHESYVSTVWYQEEKLKETATLDYVNRMLCDDENKLVKIALYAHRTVAPPKMEKEISWIYGKHAFDVTDASDMMTAVGAEEYGDVSALVFSALSEGGSGAFTRLSDKGTYLVTASLNPAYGVWKSPSVTQLTLGQNDARTMEITLVILAVFGLAAVVLTIALVLVRSRAGRKKRRELTSEEVIDKFIAAGGRTRLKK